MGLILGIVAAVGTILAVIFAVFADGMSDAPSESGISLWPIMLIGFGISGVLLLSHFLHWSW